MDNDHALVHKHHANNVVDAAQWDGNFICAGAFDHFLGTDYLVLNDSDSGGALELDHSLDIVGTDAADLILVEQRRHDADDVDVGRCVANDSTRSTSSSKKD